MAQEKTEPQTAVERIGALLFPLRGIPGILFGLAIALPLGTPAGDLMLNWPVGLALLGAGEGMRLLSRRYIGRSSSTRTAKVSRLVTGGPYRFVRNPIYLGNLGILAGFGGVAGLWWTAALFLPIVLGIYVLIAAYESRIVLACHPEEGAAYLSAVPAWIPSFTAASVPASDPLPWNEVFRREGSTFFGILLGIAFLLARQMEWIPGRFLVP